jgi:spectinomycin phosphotransferase
VVSVTFIPSNYVNTAIYRVVADDDNPYFLKLSRDAFDENSVAIPKFLSDRGIEHIIAPLALRTQELWTHLDNFNVVLYPFVEGHNGFEVELTDWQWIAFGAVLKAIHAVTLPVALANRVQRENYLPRWREKVMEFQALVETETFNDPTAAKLAAFLRDQRSDILYLVDRAERLGVALQARSPECVLCHSDIHLGNVLVSTDDTFYLVDWANPILAPKERDLMFIGGGIGKDVAAQEESLFYQGYGQTEIDPITLAYYRYERIVEDIATYCEEILLSDESPEDRENGFRHLTSAFLPNSVIEIARRSESILPPEFRFEIP